MYNPALPVQVLEQLLGVGPGGFEQNTKLWSFVGAFIDHHAPVVNVAQVDEEIFRTRVAH